MNLETKITIYKFTPQLFTLTPYNSCFSEKDECNADAYYWQRSQCDGWLF